MLKSRFIQFLNKHGLNIVLFFISIIILVLPAILNKYPLLHPDLGTYIISGFKHFVPKDRPIFYGLFLRHVSLAYSLWFVIIAQAIIGFYLINLFLRNFNFERKYLISFVTILLLYILTGLSHNVSQPSPDIFASYGLLVLLIFISQELRFYEKTILSILLVFCIVNHLSHMMVITSFVFLLFVAWAISKGKIGLIKANVFILLGIVVFSWLLVPIANRAYSHNSSYSKGKSVVVAARLLDMGILTSFLKENCNDSNYIFCDKIEELENLKSHATFLWNHASPLYSGGCKETSPDSCWAEKAPELERLIFGILKTPEFRKKLIGKAIQGSWQQFRAINLKKFVPLLKGSSVHYPIHQYLPKDYNRYINAKQATQGVQYKTRNKIAPFIYIGSLIISLMVFILWGGKERIWWLVLYFAILSHYILNAAICSTFSAVVGRYQNRIAWVITFLLIAFVFSKLLANRKNVH